MIGRQRRGRRRTMVEALPAVGGPIDQQGRHLHAKYPVERARAQSCLCRIRASFAIVW